MICTSATTKEDVVLWFKELESYRRIDTMCTLLNMCLPFELRFLGTCLEELGRRDSQELRGIELRVNNTQELTSDVASCRLGEPTDLKIRRKMAMYLALIRACSRTCVAELFHTLDGWGDRDFRKFGDAGGAADGTNSVDPLHELLLVYTMAANHPVFSFEQRMKCGEIYTRISECNRALLAGGDGGAESDNNSINNNVGGVGGSDNGTNNGSSAMTTSVSSTSGSSSIGSSASLTKLQQQQQVAAVSATTTPLGQMQPLPPQLAAAVMQSQVVGQMPMPFATAAPPAGPMTTSTSGQVNLCEYDYDGCVCGRMCSSV